MTKEIIWLLAILVILVGGFILLWKKKGINFTLSFYREQAYRLMLAIEKKNPNWIGSKKMRWVVEQIYAQLPKFVKYFLSIDDILDYMQLLFDKIKDYLDNGVLDNSVNEGDK